MFGLNWFSRVFSSVNSLPVSELDPKSEDLSKLEEGNLHQEGPSLSETHQVSTFFSPLESISTVASSAIAVVADVFQKADQFMEKLTPYGLDDERFSTISHEEKDAQNADIQQSSPNSANLESGELQKLPAYSTRKEIYARLNEIKEEINKKPSLSEEERNIYNQEITTLEDRLSQLPMTVLERIQYVFKTLFMKETPFLLSDKRIERIQFKIDNAFRGNEGKWDPWVAQLWYQLDRKEGTISSTSEAESSQSKDVPITEVITSSKPSNEESLQLFRAFFLNVFGISEENAQDYSIVLQKEENGKKHYILEYKAMEKTGISASTVADKLGLGRAAKFQLGSSSASVSFPESLPFTVEEKGDLFLVEFNAEGKGRKDPAQNVVLKMGTRIHAKIETLAYNMKTKKMDLSTVAMTVENPPSTREINLLRGTKAPVFELFQEIHQPKDSSSS
jgi:hypothetical protein